METRLFSYDDLKGLLSIEEAIRVVEEVYRAHGEGKIIMPAKITLDLGESGGWPHHDSYINSMPAYLGDQRVAGIKVVGGYWKNPQRGLPSIMGLILLLNPESGEPIALMEGAYITSLRTGAQAAVGAKFLGRQGAETLGLIGAGTQGRFSTRAISKVLNLKKILVTDAIFESAKQFAREMEQELNIEVDALEDALEVSGSDIVVSATTSRDPVVVGKEIREGALVISLGSYREIDEHLVTGADRILVDNFEQAAHRGALADYIREGVIQSDRIGHEIGKVVAGTAPGRTNEKEIILFTPIGMGSTDVATAYAAYQKAEGKSLGSKFRFT